MKVIKNEKIINKDHEKTITRELTWDEENDQAFNNSRTPFWISFLFLLIFVLVPFVIFYLFTSPDLSLPVTVHYNIGIGIGIGFATIFGIFIITIGAFLLKIIKYDQFTYNFTLSWILFAIYFTGYVWSWHDALYRILVAFGFMLVAVLIGSFISIWFRNLQLYWEMKKTKTDKQESTEN